MLTPRNARTPRTFTRSGYPRIHDAHDLRASSDDPHDRHRGPRRIAVPVERERSDQAVLDLRGEDFPGDGAPRSVGSRDRVEEQLRRLGRVDRVRMRRAADARVEVRGEAAPGLGELL